MAKATKNQSGRRRLGRGLGSLMGSPMEVEVTPTSPTEATANPEPTPPAEDQVVRIPLDKVRPNSRQPRQHFDPGAIQALALSIKSAGVIQPVVVRPAESGMYELIAGERRWRAARQAELDSIPALVREMDDRDAAEWALVENLQREDLNPVERAQAFARLIDEFEMTHKAIAEAVGLDRSSVSNHLRLLELDEATLNAVEQGRLTMGHAKALLSLTNLQSRKQLAETAIDQEWSVRELERQARDQTDESSSTAPDKGQVARSALPAHMVDLERRLGEHLGTKVKLRPGRKKGQGHLVIEFFDLDQFEGLLQHMRFRVD